MTTATLKIPTDVVDSDWKDDIDYQTYDDEKTYVSPSDVTKETIAKIKSSPIKLSIDGLWKLREDTKKVTA